MSEVNATREDKQRSVSQGRGDNGPVYRRDRLPSVPVLL